MNPDDDELLTEELVARMALYDAGLAEGSDPGFLRSAPLTPGLVPRWQRVEACLRWLRRASAPASAPGTSGSGSDPAWALGRHRVR
jgi:hypothetical protein